LKEITPNYTDLAELFRRDKTKMFKVRVDWRELRMLVIFHILVFLTKNHGPALKIEGFDFEEHHMTACGHTHTRR
jgi:hypothetical protein